MPRKVAAWTGLLGGLGLLDALLDRRHDGSTLSEATRWAKGQHPYGDAIFTGIWVGFAYWFWNHIINGGK